MISDQTALKDIRELWQGVETLRGRVQRTLLGSFANGGHSVILIADIAHNLPFIHACAVLNDVLEQLAKQKRFDCKSRFLGSLLDASRDKLHWDDFAIVRDAAD